MRNLTLTEVELVSGGGTEAALLVGGLAVVSVVALGSMVLSSSRSYPSNIAYMSPYEAYDQGYSNGYYASLFTGFLSDLLHALFITAINLSDDDE